MAFPAGLNINLCRQGTISPGKCDPGLRQHCFALFIDSMSEKCCCFPQRINVSECRSPGAAKTEADYSCREMFKCLARGRQSLKSIVCCFVVVVVFACLFLSADIFKESACSGLCLSARAAPDGGVSPTSELRQPAGLQRQPPGADLPDRYLERLLHIAMIAIG